MNDEDTVRAAPALAPERDPDILLYDYSKYLLTLSILVLGGVLSLLQGPDADALSKHSVLVIIALLAVSGISSLSAANEIVRARTDGRAVRKRSRWFSQIAMGTLGGGVGAFLALWTEALR